MQLAFTVREAELLAHIAAGAEGMTRRFPRVVVGPGDDCAVVRVGDETLLLTVDHVIEGRHFEAVGLGPGGARLDLVARKAVARSVSDIAGMGGAPVCALATAALAPGFGQEAAAALADALHRWGAHWDCPVVGGDVAVFAREHPGPLTLTVTVVGRAHARRGPVLRSGSRPGDAVYVTGTIGGSGDGERHLRFEPRVREAAWLCDLLGPGGPTAMIDISDGLGRDAARVGAASGACLLIDAGAIPLTPGIADWRRAAGEGEDYELLFTCATGATVPAVCPATGVAITRIGLVGAPDGEFGAGCVFRQPDGTRVDGAELGWDHA